MLTRAPHIIISCIEPFHYESTLYNYIYHAQNCFNSRISAHRAAGDTKHRLQEVYFVSNAFQIYIQLLLNKQYIYLSSKFQSDQIVNICVDTMPYNKYNLLIIKINHRQPQSCQDIRLVVEFSWKHQHIICIHYNTYTYFYIYKSIYLYILKYVHIYNLIMF